MRRIFPLVLTFSVLLIVVSCKKSSTSSSSDTSLTGNWNFIDLTAQTRATATSGPITNVTTSSYKTTNNAGTISFTNDSMIVKGLTYTADTTATDSTYQGSTLLSATVAPFSVTVPATSQTVSYQLISADSIYLPNGGIVPGGGASSGAGTGAHYVIKNDTLVLTIQASQTVSGVAEVVNGAIYLKRQ